MSNIQEAINVAESFIEEGCQCSECDKFRQIVELLESEPEQSKDNLPFWTDPWGKGYTK